MRNALTRFVAQQIPDSAANIAAAKKKMEKELRADGYSRSHAMAVVAEHFRKNG